MMLEIMGQGCARGLANPELLDAVAQQRLELWVTMQALRHVRHARLHARDRDGVTCPTQLIEPPCLLLPVGDEPVGALRTFYADFAFKLHGVGRGSGSPLHRLVDQPMIGVEGAA